MDANYWEPGAKAGTPHLFVHCEFIATYQDFKLLLNTALISQLQATVLGLLASLMATLLGWMAEGKMPLNHMMLLCSTSVSTAFVASLLQGNDKKSPMLSMLKFKHMHDTTLQSS